MMNSQFFQVSQSLRHDIVGIRITQGIMAQAAIIKTCAMVAPGIVFQLGERGLCIERITTRSHIYRDVPTVFAHGCRLEPSIMHFAKGAYVTLQIALEPWALRTVFGLNGSQVTSKLLVASDFDAVRLEARLVEAIDTKERIRVVEEFLKDQLGQHGQQDELTEESVAYINEHIPSVTIQVLTAHLNVTSRLLEKHFMQFIGCSPQKYIQIKRMNAALHLMWTGQYHKLLDVAHALNYYDQAHFIRDMKAFSWLTPKAITQSIAEFRQDESGIAYI